MRAIGLTGGIGSGKTIVARLFSNLGVETIDADQIARDLVKPSTTSFADIVAHFGPTILTKDKQINREKLREIIFDKTEEKLWLEKLLHPLIITEIEKRIQNTRSSYSIVMIPLLFETGGYDFLDRVLVVDASEDLQVKRTQERDHCTAEHAKVIIASQMNRKDRLARGDDIIENNGDLDSLQRKVASLHHYYLGLAQSSSNGQNT